MYYKIPRLHVSKIYLFPKTWYLCLKWRILSILGENVVHVVKEFRGLMDACKNMDGSIFFNPFLPCILPRVQVTLPKKQTQKLIDWLVTTVIVRTPILGVRKEGRQAQGLISG